MCPGAQVVLAWDGAPVRQGDEGLRDKPSKGGVRAGRPADWRLRCDQLRAALAALFPTLYDPAEEADVEIARFVKARPDRAVIVSTDGGLAVLLSDSGFTLFWASSRTGDGASCGRIDFG
jgi:hypothetical protein